MPVQEITEARMSSTPAPQPRVTAETAAAAAPPGVRVLLPLAVATGVLLWLCYFPTAWGWLAWAALVPLLFLIRSTARPRTIYLSAFVGGLVFYWPALQWMRVADPRMYVTWGGLATYCAAYFPLTIFLVRYLDRRTALPLPLTLPVVWTALEFFRSQFGTGFSWYLLGYTQHDFLPMIQIADLTGVYGVSFLVVAVNGVLFEMCWSSVRCRQWLGRGHEPARWGRRALAVQTLIILIGLIGTFTYGVIRIQQAAFTPGPRLALVQGNVPQQVRNQARLAYQLVQNYESLTHLAFMYGPDMIVWPETSYPGEFFALAPDAPTQALSEDWQEGLRRSRRFTRIVHQDWPTNLLAGLNSYVLEEDGTGRRYNSALLIDAQGKVAGRYDKIHRVPFGEYVPLRESLPFMNRLAPYDFEYGVAAGRRHTQFPMTTKDGRQTCSFGVAICYEDTVPDLVNSYGGGGEYPTDFLLNISNDGWFDGTSEHEEHLAICRFRAVECRRAVGRAVNMGISAVIDGNGRVLRPREIPHPEHIALFAGCVPAGSLCAFPWPALAMRQRGPHVWDIPANPAEQEELPLAQWGQYKKAAGLLFASIPIDHRTSLYARWGDWLPWSCWGLLAAALVFARFRRVVK